jgi:hypothetical protein
MKRSAALWTLAAVITLVAASWQRRTGPSYPSRVSYSLGGEVTRLKLPRSHETTSPALVIVAAPDSAVTGTLVWRRYPTGEPFAAIAMERRADSLVAALPVQPPAGKVEYYVQLARGGRAERVPALRAVVLRYRGPVQVPVLVPHVLMMFLGLLVGTRTALGAIANEGDRRRLLLTTLGLLTVGGLILGPIVQKQAFGAYWTGVPFGWDLTDNKTLLMWVGWFVAAVLGRGPVVRWVVLAASVLMFAAYVVPHSTMGSELDYSTIPAATR